MSESDDRLELTPDASAALRGRREALHAAVSRLDRDLDTLEARSDPDPDQVRSALAAMHTTLREHVEGADAPDGPLSQIMDTAPWLATRAQRLRDEHQALLERASTLLARVDELDDLAPLLPEARNLSAQVARHRHRATGALQDAFTLDIAASD